MTGEEGSDGASNGASNGASKPTSMTVSEVTGLVNLFTSMLSTSTAQIIGRIDDNARVETERWTRHDVDLERNREAIVARFLKVETALDSHLMVANIHFAKEHDEDLVMDARVRPVRSAGDWLARNWRTILLFIFGILALLGFSGETLQRLTGN